MSTRNIKLTASTSFSHLKPQSKTYQNSQLFMITGREKKHIRIKDSNEIKRFNRINLKKLPNSNRVLIPESSEQPKTINRPFSSCKFNTDSSQFAYISNVDYTVRKKPLSPTIRESHDFTNTKHSYISLKRKSKETPYTNYSTTTQIVNLPGGVKRKDINDDRNHRAMNTSNSYKVKIKNDYHTNISCLPGCPYNKKKYYKEDIPQKRKFNNRSQSDIFNLKCDDSKTKFVPQKRIFPEKNNTCSPVKMNGIKRTYNRNQSTFNIL